MFLEKNLFYIYSIQRAPSLFLKIITTSFPADSCIFNFSDGENPLCFHAMQWILFYRKFPVEHPRLINRYNFGTKKVLIFNLLRIFLSCSSFIQDSRNSNAVALFFLKYLFLFSNFINLLQIRLISVEELEQYAKEFIKNLQEVVKRTTSQLQEMTEKVLIKDLAFKIQQIKFLQPDEKQVFLTDWLDERTKPWRLHGNLGADQNKDYSLWKATK